MMEMEIYNETLEGIFQRARRYTGTNIGRGTSLLRNMPRNPESREILYSILNRPFSALRQSKAEQHATYNKLKANIPDAWRAEDLSFEKCTSSHCILSYLESYGPLSALVFERSQRVINSIEKEQDFADGGDMSELVYLSLTTDIMDFMKFMQRILSFY
jgi:tRNA(Ile)-lysidine synthase TilS/MesJ